jgi:oxalate decarboxylase/phosphoglucose isomerase-like protein (cupin superfamily)
MTSTASTHSSATGDTVSVGGDEIVFRVTSGESAGAVTALEVRMPPGGGPPMLHRHDFFELYRVEAGELVFYVEDGQGTVRRTMTGRGAVVGVPSGREHTIRNESAEEARAFAVFSPGETMERFAREAAALAASGPAGIGEVLALASALGIEMTRPADRIA